MRSREALKILLSSGSGKAGVLFFVALVMVSLYVVATYPLDFGTTRWNSPTEWSDNPKSAPPRWWGFLGRGEHTTHRVFRTTEPSSTVSAGEGETRLYTFQITQESGVPPSFISFTVSDVLYHAEPPVITFLVQRPDGKELRLYRDVVRRPRPGEIHPISRYAETPLRVYLSGNRGALENTADFLRREFGLTVSPEQLSGNLDRAIFGVPVGPGPSDFEVLQGTYEVSIQVAVRDPADSIGKVKLVRGGTLYGLMGTDTLGRDLATGLLFGFPVALVIGISTAILATLIGVSLGIISGFSGGKTDISIQRLSDVMTNIPLLPILIFLIFILGQKLWLVVAILVAFGWPGLTIVTRSMVIQIRSGQLVEATQSLGASRWRIMFRHILFQIAPFVLAQMIFFTPAAILAEAGLSFLGLGDPSIPTWGQILQSGFQTGAVFLEYWWWILPPGLLIVITAMTFVLLTLGLEPVVNPKLRAAQ